MMIFARLFVMVFMAAVWAVDSASGPMGDWRIAAVLGGLWLLFGLLDFRAWRRTPKPSLLFQIGKELIFSGIMLVALPLSSTPFTYVMAAVVSGMWMVLAIVEVLVWSRTVPVKAPTA